MLRSSLWCALLGAALCFCGQAIQAADTPPTKAEYEKLKRDLAKLREVLRERTPITRDPAAGFDQELDNKYGPNAKATTRTGKLTIGGLLQVWYYTIQNDNMGWVDGDAVNGGPGSGFGSNEVNDNDSFRIRRSELSFTMDVHENITAKIEINPAAEASSFPSFPTNQGSGRQPVYFNSGSNIVGSNQDGQLIIDENSAVAAGNIRNSTVRSGGGDANRMLQDAYINFHGIMPHHDLQVGQMKRRLGEEGVRSSAQLDFVERAMITQLNDDFDMGLQVHGFWWDDRFQYWGGVFNGAGTAFQSTANRSDDNDAKDLVASVLLRPIWHNETWGSMELGYSILYGIGGEAGGRNSGPAPVDGLNRSEYVRTRQYAWGLYRAGGPVEGMWLRGEWGLYRDRFAPNVVSSAPGEVLFAPGNFSVQGWTVSTGYHLGNSVFADGLDQWAKRAEFTFRYDVMENLFFQDLVNPSRKVDVFKTQVFTAGLNYYLKEHNAKLQLNYNWVVEEDNVDKPNTNGNFNNGRQVREVRNDNFVVNFQVAW